MKGKIARNLEDREEAIQLYCFADRSCPDVAVESGAGDGGPVEVLRGPKLAAVVGRVSRDFFCGPGAEGRLSDLNFLAPHLMRYQRVIQGVMTCSPVLPLRFGTLFSSCEALEASMARHEEDVLRFLDEVRGKGEWALKGLWNEGDALASRVERLLEERGDELASSPGKRYFQERRLRDEARKGLRRDVDAVCEPLLQALGSLAADFRERRLLPSDLAGGKGTMIVNRALLVEEDAVEEMKARVESSNREFALAGLAFTLTGPWPPYTFAPSFEEP